MDVVTVNVRQVKADRKNIGFINYLGQEGQSCLGCGFRIGNIAGSKEAVCNNCGYKDPCCE